MTDEPEKLWTYGARHDNTTIWRSTVEREALIAILDLLSTGTGRIATLPERRRFEALRDDLLAARRNDPGPGKESP